MKANKKWFKWPSHKSQQPWFREYCLKMSNFEIEMFLLKLAANWSEEYFQTTFDGTHTTFKSTQIWFKAYTWQKVLIFNFCMSCKAFANPLYSFACLKGFLVVHWGFKVFLLL